MSETIFSRRPNRAIWKTAPLLVLLLSVACAPGGRTAEVAEAAQAGTAPADTLSVTVAVSGMALFLIGAVLSLFSGRNAFYGGARMMAIGAAAGLATFAIGSLLGVGFG